MLIPEKINYHFFSSKMALYKQIKLNVQKSNKGTSGVELNDKIEINRVEEIKMSALSVFLLDKKYEANL